MELKLFRVMLRGMNNSGTGTNYGSPYVVAEDPTSAYEIVRSYVKKRNLGFRHERELKTVELLAEIGDYPDCREQLFLSPNKKNEAHSNPLPEIVE